MMRIQYILTNKQFISVYVIFLPTTYKNIRFFRSNNVIEIIVPVKSDQAEGLTLQG